MGLSTHRDISGASTRVSLIGFNLFYREMECVIHRGQFFIAVFPFWCIIGIISMYQCICPLEINSTNILSQQFYLRTKRGALSCPSKHLFVVLLKPVQLLRWVDVHSLTLHCKNSSFYSARSCKGPTDFLIQWSNLQRTVGSLFQLGFLSAVGTPGIITMASPRNPETF